MKYRGLKRAIVMLLALTMLLTSTGMATFAESLNEEAANPSQDAVATEQAEEAQEEAAPTEEAKSEETAAEEAKEEAKEEAPDAATEDAKEEAKEEAKDEASDKAAEDQKLTAKDWEKDLPKDVSKDAREAMAQVAKSQVDGEADLYKAFANADSIKDGDASFVMFVLEYANVLGVKKAIGDDNYGTVKSGDLEIPVNADIKKWVKELKDADIYKEVENDATPEQGDIVFTHSIISTDAAVVLSNDEGKLEVAGIETEKKADKVSKYTIGSDELDGFVSLKDIAPENFDEEAVEEQKEEPAEEAADAENAENAEAANKTDELTEEELAAKKAEEEAARAEEAAERAAKAEKEAAKRAEEEAAKAEEAGLTDQKADAELTAAPGIGGKLRSLFSSNKDKGVTISGYMPEGATVKAYPVKVKIPGQNILAAYDITIYVKDENGNDVEWQPEIPLNVSITSKKVDNSFNTVNVFHMEEIGDEPAFIATAETEDNSVEFSADSFSIYIISQDALTKTYTFMNGSKVYSKQTLQDGNSLVKPADPFREGAEFLYWSETEGGDEFTGFGEAQEIKEDADTAAVTLYAVFSDDRVFVTYYDQDGTVVERHALKRPVAGTEDAKLPREYTEEMNFNPAQKNEGTFLKFRYWTDNQNNLSLSNPPEAGKEDYMYDDEGNVIVDSNNEPIRVNGVIKINPDSKDINLYPVTAEGHWIYFDVNKKAIGGDSASVNYVAPKFVVNGDTTEFNAVPARTDGYTFKGWYTSRNGGSQVFDENGEKIAANYTKLLDVNGNLANDPTLYAHWEVISDTTYTVVIWKQKVPDSNDPDKVEYVYKESFTENAQAGDVIKPREPSSQWYKYTNLNNPATYNSVYGTSYASDYKTQRENNPYFGCAYHAEPGDQSVTVKPGGKTVVNIHYRLNERKLTFVVGEKIGNNTYKPTTETYSQPSTQYGIVNGTVVDLSWRNNKWQYNAGGWIPSWTDYSNTRYYRESGDTVETVYTLERRYGTNIRDKFPIVGTNGVTYSSDEVGQRWYPMNSTIYNDVVVFMELMPDEDITFRLDKVERPKKTVNYYVQALPNETGTTVSYNGKQYILHGGVPMTMRVNYCTDSEDFYPLEGMTKLVSDPAAIGDNIGTIGAEETINFYYTRNQYKIDYYDSMHPQRKVRASYDQESGENRKVYFEEGMEDYISEETVKPGSQFIPDNMSFDGWYLDRECTTKVFFEANEEYNKRTAPKQLFDKMPAYDLTLYAGWAKNRYKVDIDPDGGEIGKPINDFATYFSVYYDETIAEYENVIRDYVYVGQGNGTHNYVIYKRDSDPNEDPNPEYANYDSNWKRTAKYVEAENDGEGEYKYEPGAYIFQGWYEVLSSGHLEPFNFAKQVDHDIKLKAKWRKPGLFSIKYVANDGSTIVKAPVDKDEYFDGAHAIVKDVLTAPEGKVLDHWVDKKGHTYKPNATMEIAEDIADKHTDGNNIITLTAVYRNVNTSNAFMADYTFKVRSSADSTAYKEEAYDVQTIAAGERLVMPKTPSDLGNLKFKGWYLDEECTRRFEGFGTISFPVYTTLYAGYVESYEVTYYMVDEKDDGTFEPTNKIVTTQTYQKGEKLNTLYVDYPTDEDHEVLYWTDSLDSTGTHYKYKAINDTVSVTSDMELWPGAFGTAKHLNFVTGCSTVIEPVRIPDVGWPTRPKEPIREGYNFMGWYTDPTYAEGTEYDFDEPLNVPAGQNEMTVYAKWEYDTTSPKKGQLNIIWWAQTPDRPADDSKDLSHYEMIATMNSSDFSYGTYSASDIISHFDNMPYGNEGKTLTANDIQSVIDYAVAAGNENAVEFKKRYGNDSQKIKDNYFEYDVTKSTKTDLGSDTPSDKIIAVEDTGNSVINVYFDLKEYWIALDARRAGTGNTYSSYPLGVVHYDNKIYTFDGDNTNYGTQGTSQGIYKIKVWLNRNIEDLWPTQDKARSDNPDKAYLEWKETGGAFQYWVPKTNTLSYAGSMQVIADDKKIDAAAANANNTITYTLSSADNLTRNAKVHYMLENLDGNFEDRFNEDKPIKGSGEDFTDAHGFKFYKGLSAKPIEAFTNIHDYNEEGNYNVPRDGLGQARIVPAEGHETVTVDDYDYRYYYSISNNWANTTFYHQTSRQVGLFGLLTEYDYHELTFNPGNAHTEGDYTLTWQNGSSTENGKGDYVWYYDEFGFPRPLTWSQFENDVLNVEKRYEKVGEHTEERDSNFVDLYFYYTRDSYKLDLMLSKTQGWSGNTNIDVKYETKLTGQGGMLDDDRYIPAAEAPQGKQFDCWSISPDTREPFAGTMPSHGLKLYAWWKPVQHTVTTVGYKTDGTAVQEGEDDGVFLADYNTEFGKVNQPNEIKKPRKMNATFLGWYMKDANNKMVRVPSTYKITDNITVYARFDEYVKHKIVYDNNSDYLELNVSGTVPVDGASYISGAEATVMGIVNGSELKVTRKDVDGKDYDAKFVCWNTRPDGKGYTYYPGDKIRVDSENETGEEDEIIITLYAQYDEYRETTLTYNINTEDTNAAFVTVGEDGKPQKTNKLDDEYVENDDDDTSTVLLRFKDDLNTAHATANAGRPNIAITVGETSDQTKFTVVREGYIFRGWSLQPTGAVVAKNGDTAYANQLAQGGNTLYAKWEKRAELTLNGVENIYIQDNNIADTMVDSITWEDDSDKTYDSAGIEELHATKVAEKVAAQHAASLHAQVIDILEQKSATANSQQIQSLLDKAKSNDPTIVGDLVELGLSQEDAEAVATEIRQIDQSEPSNPLDGYVLAHKVLVDKTTGKAVTGIKYVLGDGTEADPEHNIEANLNRWQYTTDGTTYVDLDETSQIDIYYYRNPVQVKVFNVVTDKDNKIVKHIKNAVPAQGSTPAQPEALENLTSSSLANSTVSVSAKSTGEADTAVTVTGDSMHTVDGNKYYLKGYAVEALPTTAALTKLESISMTNDSENGIKLNGTPNTGLYSGTKVVYVVYQEKPSYIKLENNSSASQTFRLTIDGGNYHQDIKNGSDTVQASAEGTGDNVKYHYDITVASEEYASIYVPCGTGFTYSTAVLKDSTPIADTDLPSEFLEWESGKGPSGRLDEGPLKASADPVTLPTEANKYSYIKLNDLPCGTLTVNNTVEGKYSNVDDPFEVTVTLEKANGAVITAAEKAKLGNGLDWPTTGEGADAVTDKTKLVCTFTLTAENGNNSKAFSNVPVGWKFKVEQPEANGYTAYMKTGSADYAKKTVENGTVASSSTVDICNTKGDDEVVPSGISGHMNMLMLIVLVFALATAEFYILIRRRRVSR